MTEPCDFDDLPGSELKHLVLQLLAENAEQARQIAALREEVARLKRLKGPPDIKPPSRPSGMERATSPNRAPGGKGRGKFTPRIGIEERVIAADAPAGSRFKGYESFLVQDLALQARAIRYRRERWVTPEGRTILAPLPAWPRPPAGGPRRGRWARLTMPTSLPFAMIGTRLM